MKGSKKAKIWGTIAIVSWGVMFVGGGIVFAIFEEIPTIKRIAAISMGLGIVLFFVTANFGYFGD